MKVFYIIYFIFLVLIAAWQYYAKKLYNNNNDKSRKRHRVLKIILNFYLIGFIVVALCHKCPSDTGKRAMLELSTSSFDFDSIKTDSIYTGCVIIKNSGNAPLVIDDINPGCGCTSVSITKNTILPEDTCLLNS
jgi:hypothetical protein